MKKIKKAIMATAIISSGNSFYHRTSGIIYHRTAGWALFTDNDSVKNSDGHGDRHGTSGGESRFPLIAIFKYHTPEQAFHEAYMPYEEKFEVLYDLVLTTPEDVIPSDVTVVHPTGIYVYCINPKLNVKRAEAGLNELLKANKLDPNLKIVTSRSTFDKRIHSLKPASEYEDDGTVGYGVSVIKGLSM